MKEKIETTKPKYDVTIREDGQNIIFEVDGGNGGIATLGIDEVSDGIPYYKLKNINSFNKEKGIGSAILRSVEQFIKSKNGVGYLRLIENSLRPSLEKHGWAPLGRGKTMAYNMKGLESVE